MMNNPARDLTRIFLAGCLLLLVGIARAADPLAQLVFTDVSVVDVVSGRLISERTVVVTGNRISAVAAAKGFVMPAGATVVPSAGMYLIPGLWDMHVHHEFPWNGLLDLALVNGVTGVRDLNSQPFVLAWRDEIKAGKRVGPRIVASGKYLDAKLNGGPPDRRTVDTPEVAREIVRERKKQGADFIKVYSGLSMEAYTAVLDEAKVQGLPVAGHCPERVPALTASRLGQRSIEHLTGIALASSRDEDELRERMQAAFTGPHGYDFDAVFPLVLAGMETQDDGKQADLFAAFKQNHTWQVPTLVTLRPLPSKNAVEPRLKYMHPGNTQLWAMIQGNDRYTSLREAVSSHGRATVRAMHKAGVPLLAGTDAGGAINVHVFPGFSLADELELLVECGLTPADALRTATLNPALYLGEEETSGTVEVGKQANLVLLTADPLISIANVRKINGVLVDGRWLSRAELDKMLERLAEANAKVEMPK